MVTAKDSEADKVTGLELGADDYVTKPFSVRARLPGAGAPAEGEHAGELPLAEEMLRGGRWRWIGRHEVRVRGRRQFPAEGVRVARGVPPSQGVLTRLFLIEEVWRPTTSATRTLDVHVKRVRQKIEDDPHLVILVTVRGLGYRFVDHA